VSLAGLLTKGEALPVPAALLHMPHYTNQEADPPAPSARALEAVEHYEDGRLNCSTLRETSAKRPILPARSRRGRHLRGKLESGGARSCPGEHREPQVQAKAWRPLYRDVDTSRPSG